jgi:Staphylococcal nuclease homologue
VHCFAFASSTEHLILLHLIYSHVYFLLLQYLRAVGDVTYGKYGPFFRKDLSLQVLRKGYAVVYRGGGAEYNGKAKEMKEIVATAKQKRLGMWSAEHLETPGQFKARMRRSQPAVASASSSGSSSSSSDSSSGTTAVLPRPAGVKTVLKAKQLQPTAIAAAKAKQKKELARLKQHEQQQHSGGTHRDKGSGEKSAVKTAKRPKELATSGV